jgi:ATP-binding cassette subfamily B protein
MTNERIYLEETHAATVGTLTLLLFFKRFFTPYIKAIIVTIIFAFCVTGTELLLPHLLKLTIDRHLTASARKISLTSVPAHISQLLDKYGQSLIPCVEEGCFFILPDELKNIQEHEIKQLKDAGILIPEKFYFTKVSPGNSELLKKHKDLFYRAGDYAFIPYAYLSELNKNDLMRLRVDDIRGITQITGIFLIILLFSLLFNFSQVYLVEYTSQKIMHDIRIDIFSHLQSRCLSFFTRNPVGRLVTRATNDVQNLHEMFSALFANILKDIFIILGITVILFWINWKLSFVCFATLPFLICCTALFSVQSRKAFREVRIKIAAMNSIIQENISGISVVKAFCREKLNEMRFQELNHQNYLANMKQTIVFAIFNPLVDLTRITTVSLIIWYGGGRAIREAITLGTLVVFLYYMRMFFRPNQKSPK